MQVEAVYFAAPGFKRRDDGVEAVEEGTCCGGVGDGDGEGGVVFVFFLLLVLQ